SLSELGFNGLLLMIILSYLTNFLTPHGYTHNLIILIIGLTFFFEVIKKKVSKRNLVIFFSIASILFIGLLMYKNHDDFFYYHFPYTISLIEQKKILGLGHLEHGFRTPSSIFYLNSLFYLPLSKYSMINSGAIFYLLFCNVFFLQTIFNKIKNKNLDFIFILLLISFIFTNTSFYRLAEHGTDRSALILVFVLIVYYLQSINDKFQHNKKLFINYYQKIIVIILLIVSLKSFYLIYYAFLLLFIFQFREYFYRNNILKTVLLNKYTYYLIFGTIIFFVTVFLNTGCLVYPASFTCFEALEWSIPKTEVQKMKQWYELWSKGGANPNFRVDNTSLYLSGLNWIPNWIEKYFFTKVSDFIFVLFLTSLITYLLLKNKKVRLFQKRKYKLVLFLIFILFIEWFLNHPTLRYGGFTLIALLIFLPLSIHLEKYLSYSSNLLKKIYILIILTLIIYVGKNIDRLINEYIKYNYNPFLNAHFFIKENAFFFSKMIIKANIEQRKTNKYFYLVLSKELINKIQKN
ncbi:hypothetical protein OAT07_05790, partial [Candidatus Pelagibacter sp.]|nr:hypothetical protein [Candidatus Pelagibacter sp.]